MHFVLIATAPGNQLRHYYIYGDIDSCQGKLSSMLACFKGKLKIGQKVCVRKMWSSSRFLSKTYLLLFVESPLTDRLEEV